MVKKLRNNKSPIKPVFILRIIAVLGVGAVIVGLYFLLKNFFTVKAVECRFLESETCPEELQSSLSSLIGLSMFFENYSERLQQQQALNQPVSLVHFKKIFPQTVIVTFQEESAAYIIEHPNGTSVVSKAGRIFNHQVDTTNLLSVQIPSEVITSDNFIEPETHQVLSTIIETTSQLQLHLTKIVWVDKSTIKLSMENRTEEFVIDSERPILELNKLSLVLKSGEYRDIAEPKRELDLRFTMPVLRTQP